MSNRFVGVLLLVAGVVLLLLSVGADPLGVGGHPGFGWKQIAGAIVGAVMAAVGAVRMRSPAD